MMRRWLQELTAFFRSIVCYYPYWAPASEPSSVFYVCSMTSESVANGSKHQHRHQLASVCGRGFLPAAGTKLPLGRYDRDRVRAVLGSCEEASSLGLRGAAKLECDPPTRTSGNILPITDGPRDEISRMLHPGCTRMKPEIRLLRKYPVFSL